MGNAVRTVRPPQAPKASWLSTHGLVPDRLDHRGMESPKPAPDLPSGLRHRRSIGRAACGNSHVPFLGDGAWRQAPATSDHRCAPASGSS